MTIIGTKNYAKQIRPDPEAHRSAAPYHQLSFTRKGKSSTRFVRRGELTTVKQQMRNYEKLRKLVDQWINLGTELSNLKLDQQRKS